MMRSIFAVLIGLIVAFALIMLVEMLGHSLFPPPPGLDFRDPAKVNAYLRSLPAPALLFPLAAWLLATLGGGWMAAAIARRRPLLFAAIIGVLVLAATVFNLVMVPHPLWMIAAAVLGIPLMILLAARLGGRQEV